jgi:hypothetical protein
MGQMQGHVTGLTVIVLSMTSIIQPRLHCPTAHNRNINRISSSLHHGENPFPCRGLGAIPESHATLHVGDAEARDRRGHRKIEAFG